METESDVAQWHAMASGKVTDDVQREPNTAPCSSLLFSTDRIADELLYAASRCPSNADFPMVTKLKRNKHMLLSHLVFQYMKEPCSESVHSRPFTFPFSLPLLSYSSPSFFPPISLSLAAPDSLPLHRARRQACHSLIVHPRLTSHALSPSQQSPAFLPAPPWYMIRH